MFLQRVTLLYFSVDESVKFQKVVQELSESRNDKLVELENQLTAQERSEFFGKEAPQLKKAAEFLQVLQNTLLGANVL